MSDSFFFEWGGCCDIPARDIWPDGDAPETPTVDDVIAQMRKTSDEPWRVAKAWNLDLDDIEVMGKGGQRSLVRIVQDERVASASSEEDKP